MRSNPLPPPPTGGKKRIVIIGGGVSGTMSAWELARAGHDVTLLEARNLGNGASSRSAACIRQQFATPSTVRGVRYAAHIFREWRQYLGGSEVPMREVGYLFLKDYQSDLNSLKELVEMQQKAGLAEVELLDQGEIGRRFPYLELTGVAHATWCPVDGFLQPDLIYGDASRAAEALGAKIVRNAEVVEARLTDGLISSVRTKDGRTFEGDLFVNATYVWAPKTSVMCGGVDLSIVAHKRYLYVLPGLRTGQEEYGLRAEHIGDTPMIITPRAAYCRPDGRGPRMITGWAHHVEPEDATFESQDEVRPGFHHTGEREYGEAVRKELTSYIPAVGEMGKTVAVTSGYYDITPDQNPFIDYDPQVKNLLHVAGFSGHGVMQSPFTAYIVAHLVAAQVSLPCLELPFGLGEVDLRPFAVTRELASAEHMLL